MLSGRKRFKQGCQDSAIDSGIAVFDREKKSVNLRDAKAKLPGQKGQNLVRRW
jgi:hypothetical protein